MSTHFGILVPADPAEPYRLLTWKPGQLQAVLYRELPGAAEEGLDHATVVPPGAITSRGPVPSGLRLWCLGRALLCEHPDYNDWAIGICRFFGYDVAALAGPVVFVGCPLGENGGGLDVRLRDWLCTALTPPPASVYCPFTDDGRCRGGCPSGRERACITGNPDRDEDR